jgi:hypothetical protein
MHLDQLLVPVVQKFAESVVHTCVTVGLYFLKCLFSLCSDLLHFCSSSDGAVLSVDALTGKMVPIDNQLRTVEVINHVQH